MKKSKKPSPQVEKCLAVGIILGSLLNTGMSGDPKLVGLSLQIEKALKVFHHLSPRAYFRVRDDVLSAWEILCDTYGSNTVTSYELEVFVEMIGSLIPRDHYKKFFGLSAYRTSQLIADEKKSQYLTSALEIDAKLNEICGTDATQTRDGLGAIISKPAKAKKAKVSKHEKGTPHRLKKLKKRVEYIKRKVKNGE